MISTRDRWKKGFTLVEIVVCIALIVALAAFGLFQYSQVQENSKKQIDIANSRVLADAVLLGITEGKIDGKNLTKADYSSITGLNQYLSNDLAIQSQFFGGKDATYRVTVDNDQKISVYSSLEDKQMYPQPSN